MSKIKQYRRAKLNAKKRFLNKLWNDWCEQSLRWLDRLQLMTTEKASLRAKTTGCVLVNTIGLRNWHGDRVTGMACR